jgi:NADPH:quinone reductase
MGTTEPVPGPTALDRREPRPGDAVRAVRADAPGDPGGLRVVDVTLPELPVGHVRVAVRAAGVNRSDVLACRGILQGRFPRTLGRDFAGVVVDGPSDLLGLRVWGSGGAALGLSIDGTHAAVVDVPEDGLCPLPDEVDDIAAAASALSYVTAFHALERAGTHGPGDTVVITGAAGGVGGAAAALSRSREARVIGVVRDAEEAATLRATECGLHFAEILPAGEDLEERLVDAAAGGRVAVDVIGGPVLPAVLAAMGIRSGVCLLGAAPGSVSAINPLEFYRKELTLTGLHTGRLSGTETARALRAAGPGLASGDLTPSRISGTHPLDDASAAYRHVESGAPGRPVLVP